MCSTVRRRWGIYHSSLPLKNTMVHVMERYELTFTMIARIFQIHQHWTLHRRICCCWMIAYKASRIKPKRTTLVVDTTIVIRYTLLKTISDYLDMQFDKIQTLLSFSHKTGRISLISMLITVLVAYPSWKLNSFAMGYGVKSIPL